MKRKSHALNNPDRRDDFIESEARYLLRLSEQMTAPRAWDEQIAIYEDYRHAHQSLVRAAALHGIGPEALPRLMELPSANGSLDSRFAEAA